MAFPCPPSCHPYGNSIFKKQLSEAKSQSLEANRAGFKSESICLQYLFYIYSTLLEEAVSQISEECRRAQWAPEVWSTNIVVPRIRTDSESHRLESLVTAFEENLLQGFSVFQQLLSHIKATCGLPQDKGTPRLAPYLEQRCETLHKQAQKQQEASTWPPTSAPPHPDVSATE